MPDEDPRTPPRPRPPEGATVPPAGTTDGEQGSLARELEELTSLAQDVSATEPVSLAPSGPSSGSDGGALVERPATLALSDLMAEVAHLRAELVLAVKEREAALGDAEQLASESRELSSKLTLATAGLEREKALRRSEVEEERGARGRLENDLSSSREELQRTLQELGAHRGGKAEAEKMRVGWDKAEQELRAREAELETMRTEKERGEEARSRAEAELEAAKAEVARLTHDLSESRSHTARLQGELEAAHAAPPKPPASSEPSPAAPAKSFPKLLPSVPVLFLGSDGRSVAQQAFFAVGKGEALEAFLSTLLTQWKGSKLPLVATGGPEGLSVQLRGDPHRRSLRMLPSGALQLQLSPSELSELGKLPTLVSRKRATPLPS
ncbi:MAG: hypothetical protein KGJ69_01240 [Thermoplasmata archaeon]|nr:hypothetical protein [Thermoplasmata archaeon]